MAAAPAMAGAGVKQSVAAKQRRLIGARQKAHMAHGVAGGVEDFKLHRSADADHVAGGKPGIHAADFIGGARMGQNFGAGRRHHAVVTADMVVMVMGVQNLGDLPALFLGGGQALVILQRIDGQRLAAIRAGDQIIEIAVLVLGPDLFD